MKVNKTIPPRQVEISLLTRCIATRRQEKIFEENSEADEDEARLHNFSSSAEKLLVRIYLFLSLSLFFFLIYERISYEGYIDGNYHGKLFNILTRNRKEDRR